MDYINWKHQIDKRGGMKNVVQMIFDSGKFHYIKPDIPVEEQVEYDEKTDSWVFYFAQQPVTFNNKKVPIISVEENENLQSIVFVKKESDKRFYRADI